VGVVVGQIVGVTDHPRGDHIWLAEVDLGDGQPATQIVFGGNRKLRVGDLVPVAPPRARVIPLTPPNGARPKKMRRRRIRGEMSHGMLCSLHELGWLTGGPDEVAILRNVTPGDRLDELPAERRPFIVIGWTHAAEIALGGMVDEVLETPPNPCPPGETDR
jgi:tRNA-binding EMAP/Myf-like protein